ncbi:hypothetical protein GF406_16690 [candidate division KSB1 bacterium]|nr:hypothetical protein [candidate division KSB1 bacterium]
MNDKQHKVETLDPYRHREAVWQFLDYFDLQRQSPSLSFLQTLTSHYSKFPYENISKILKLYKDFFSVDRIRLPEEVLHDYIDQRLGGTCWSLTFFLQTILLNLGYVVYPITAHMRNRPNWHCALILLWQKKHFLIDPGYLLNVPLQLHPDQPRVFHTEHTGVELHFDRAEETYHLYTFNRDQRKWRYAFQDLPVPSDRFLQLWLDSFYKGTMHSVLITRVKKEGMLYLHNDYLQISNRYGRKKENLENKSLHIVQELFDISPELVKEARRIIPLHLEMERQHGIYKPKGEKQ